MMGDTVESGRVQFLIRKMFIVGGQYLYELFWVEGERVQSEI